MLTLLDQARNSMVTDQGRRLLNTESSSRIDVTLVVPYWGEYCNVQLIRQNTPTSHCRKSSRTRSVCHIPHRVYKAPSKAVKKGLLLFAETGCQNLSNSRSFCGPVRPPGKSKAWPNGRWVSLASCISGFYFWSFYLMPTCYVIFLRKCLFIFNEIMSEVKFRARWMFVFFQVMPPFNLYCCLYGWTVIVINVNKH